jgi:hypothetical protein
MFHADGKTAMTNLILVVVFRNFANAPENSEFFAQSVFTCLVDCSLNSINRLVFKMEALFSMRYDLIFKRPLYDICASGGEQ